jgi:hypothetical protein
MINIPAAANRAPTPAPHPRKRQERVAVERVLQEATEPLEMRDIIAALPGVNPNAIRAAVGNIVTEGKGHMLPSRPDGNRRRYRWGRQDLPAFALVSRIPTEPYTGRELQPFSGRPGAMDAFTLPSLRGSQREPRRAPMLIASAIAPGKGGI